MQAAEFEQMRCNNKMRFILAVVAGKLVISNRKKADIEEQLISDGYDKMPNRATTVSMFVNLWFCGNCFCFLFVSSIQQYDYGASMQQLNASQQ